MKGSDEDEKRMSNCRQDIKIPKTSTGEDYCITSVKDDQQAILITYLDKIREWTEYTLNPDRKKKPFKPLRLTVRGCAESGKSYLINTMVAITRKIFGINDAVLVAAPTSAAAFNVHGQTMHHLFGINPFQPSKPVSEKKAKQLKKVLRRTVAVIMDERSMISCDVLGAAERNVAEHAHGGVHSDEDWGGIPIVILFGDDYQLPPPTNKQKGAFDTMSSNVSFSQSRLNVAAFGALQFRKLSDLCMEMNTIKCQHKSQTTFRKILEKVRICKTTTDQAETLDALHLMNYSSADREILKKDSMFLFATKAPRDNHNYSMLSKLASETNPVALIRTKPKSLINKKQVSLSHFHEDSLPVAALLCRGAMVSITGHNFEPDWGLYNNAIGYVDEIVFAPNDNPNNGDQPLYVAIKFPQYCGPAWDPDNPKIVPIPMVEELCSKDKKCCSATFCPLRLSFGRTIHTFQGQSAGPVEKDQPPNAVQRIICDPGDRAMEGNNPGLLYVLLSRATTLGNGGHLDSAIYFTGVNMSKHRVLNLRYNKKGETYKKIKLRDKWINRLDKNTDKPKSNKTHIKETTKWSKKTQVTIEQLDRCISNWKWRKTIDNNNINW